MSLLLHSDVEELAGEHAAPCISIFAPMAEKGPDTRQNRIHFKNLLAEAGGKLAARGLREQEIKPLLEDGYRVLEDSVFWQHQDAGLAWYRSADLTREFRLPIRFDPLVVVAERFHARPLLPMLAGDGRFFVLAVSENEVRLFEATRHFIAPIQLEGLPRNMDEALTPEELPTGIQWHTGTAGPGMRPAMFHGQGGPGEREKERLLRYFRRINESLQTLLRNEQAPLVLACVEHLVPIYREANTYAHLLERAVPGNADSLKKKPEQLHAEAWTLVEPSFNAGLQRAGDLYRRGEALGRAAHDLTTILPAAHDGRVATLFVAQGVQRWGSYDAIARTCEVHADEQPGDQDLLDLAAVQTYLTGGSIYPLPDDQVPSDDPIAALFRY